jgi:hypothetical protein
MLPGEVLRRVRSLQDPRGSIAADDIFGDD